MRRAFLTTLTSTVMLTLVGLSPQAALATTGQYTLPFFDPVVYETQSYGCTTYDNEPVWSGTNADGIAYGCSGASKWFHKGIDYGNFDTGTKRDIAASDEGTVKAVYNGATGSTCGTISVGNYVIIKHDDSHFSIYYHLKYDSITVEFQDKVSAGQIIGRAGNTGNSCGVHLHYELMNCKCSNSDPVQTYAPYGKWTTDPGRVPWRASFVSQSVSGTESICYGDTVTHWVKFQNLGGRTWKTTNDAHGRGRIILVSTTSSGDATQSSQFQAADWESSYTVTVADQASVVSYGNGTSTFGLKGNGVEGNYYTNYFNLKASLLRWFDYDLIGNYYIPIFIVPHQAC